MLLADTWKARVSLCRPSSGRTCLLTALHSEPNVPFLKVCTSFALTCSGVSALGGEPAGSTDEPKSRDGHLNGSMKLVRCWHRMGHINSRGRSPPTPPLRPPFLSPADWEGNKRASLKTHHSTQMMFAESPNERVRERMRNRVCLCQIRPV